MTDFHFGEFVDPTDNWDEFEKNKDSDKARKSRKRREDKLNEVGRVPPLTQEILDLRKMYTDDYVLAHTDIFPNSTGLKPYSPEQITSIKHSQHVFQHGGRVIKAEPRGFAKTSRSCNEGLLAVLQGYVTYLLIIGSNVEKASEIINSIVTELMENEMIAKMYPAITRCFNHIEANKNKAPRQTYDGNLTHIYYNEGLIRFPIIEGEPSSGAIINVRPLKNVRGIYFTDKAGPYAGQRRRPTHVILDDVQTDEDAVQPATVAKIIKRIKKSILRSGGHTKRVSAIMNATPIEPADVTHHFLLNEPGWNRLTYPMLKSRATNEDLWLVDYREILLDFNKDVPGSQTEAALRALEFFKENYDKMLEGAEATWEQCYEDQDFPQTEIHAVQHAYNIMILEGLDVFESECQCNVTYNQTSDEIVYCSAQHITDKVHTQKRSTCQVTSRYIVTHIDVNLDYLTYATCASPPTLEMQCIDYGTYPDYGTSRFQKRKMSETLLTLYPKIQTPEDRIFAATRDLINTIAQRSYQREDGIHLHNNLILVDMRYKTDYVYKAIRESNYIATTHPMQGESYRAKDKGIADKRYSERATKSHYCVLVPCTDGVLRTLIVDVNYMKTQLHIGFSREVGTQGSVSLFLPDYHNQHALVGEHCTAEVPAMDVDEKTSKEVTIWTKQSGRDNEYFDNLAGCLAGFSMLGVSFAVESGTGPGETYNMKDFVYGKKRN